MADQPIREINPDEFDALMEQYIERETEDSGEIQDSLFYEALAHTFGADVAEEVVELEGRLVGSQLQLQLTEEPGSGVEVRENEIVVHNIRFVIRMASTEPSS